MSDLRSRSWLSDREKSSILLSASWFSSVPLASWRAAFFLLAGLLACLSVCHLVFFPGFRWMDMFSLVMFEPVLLLELYFYGGLIRFDSESGRRFLGSISFVSVWPRLMAHSPL